MSIKKSKPLTGAQRTRNWKKRRIDAGLVEIKVFVHPDEAPAVRNYTANKPQTKAVIKTL